MKDVFEKINRIVHRTGYLPSHNLLLYTLILKSMHEPYRIKGKLIPTGSIFTSFLRLSEINPHFTINTVRNAIRKFTDDGLLTIESSFTGSMITFIDDDILDILGIDNKDSDDSPSIVKSGNLPPTKKHQAKELFSLWRSLGGIGRKVSGINNIEEWLYKYKADDLTSAIDNYFLTIEKTREYGREKGLTEEQLKKAIKLKHCFNFFGIASTNYGTPGYFKSYLRDEFILDEELHYKKYMIDLYLKEQKADKKNLLHKSSTKRPVIVKKTGKFIPLGLSKGGKNAKGRDLDKTVQRQV